MILFAKENRILLKVLTQDECYSATVKDTFKGILSQAAV